jgi:hypothetical protein
MNHNERATFVGWVFDSATFTLCRALKAAKLSQTDPAFQKLDAFRSEFDGRRFSDDEGRYAARWTPDYTKGVFAPLADVFDTLAGTIPDASDAAKDLRQRLAAVGPSATSDGCAALDRLLAEFMQPTLVKVSLKYWEGYRQRAKNEAKANADAATAEARLTHEIQTFYSYAREISKENDDVLGALVEEFVRTKIAGLVFPLQVSSGGVYGLAHISQIDCIIWDRQGYLPAIEVGQVAVVAPQSVRGIVEIKASYDSKLATFVERMLRLSAEGSVLRDLFGTSTTPDCLGILIWTDFDLERVEALGGSVVIPLFQRVDGKLKPNPNGVSGMLHFVRRHLLFKA